MPCAVCVVVNADGGLVMTEQFCSGFTLSAALNVPMASVNLEADGVYNQPASLLAFLRIMVRMKFLNPCNTVDCPSHKIIKRFGDDGIRSTIHFDKLRVVVEAYLRNP